MRAFLKTLFGDAWNLGAVAAIMATEAALTQTGNGNVAVYLVPLVVLIGVALLARY